MINYDLIYSSIAVGLEKYKGITVIEGDTIHEQPPYPFYALKFTTLDMGMGAVSEGMDGSIDNMTIEQDIEMVMSITCHAEESSQAQNLASSARTYFLGKGHIDLSDTNITVVDCLAITNRDVFLNIEYERRYGFDLRLRVRGQESFEIDTIEKIIMNE